MSKNFIKVIGLGVITGVAFNIISKKVIEVVRDRQAELIEEVEIEES